MEIREKIERYKEFYENDKGVIFLCNIKSCAKHEPGLLSYDFSRKEEHQRYWDYNISDIEKQIEARKGLNDYWIPGITMHYGFGAFGTIYNDHPLTFTDDTSYMHGLGDTWDLKYDKDRFWSKIFIDCAKYISERAQGRFFISPYPSPCPMDAANLIRESNLFLDVYENEEKLIEMLDTAADGIIEHMKLINENTINPHGGAMTFSRWIPSGCVVLDDAGDLCSPETYVKFVQPYTQKVLDALSGGYIHHHSLGRQQYHNISRYRNLYVQQISSDPTEPRPADDLDYILEQTAGSGTAVDLEVTPKEVFDNIDKFRQGKFILLVSLDNYNDAVEFMEKVKCFY